MSFGVCRVESPLGGLLVVTDADGAVVALEFEEHRARMEGLVRARHGAALAPGGPGEAVGLVARYFAGAVGALDAVRVAAGGTAFQARVWGALRAIPAGTTCSYGALAARLGSGARAVGHANGANAVGIIVPCHRLVGAGGALTGYSGGVERKRWLLAHEAAWSAGQG